LDVSPEMPPKQVLAELGVRTSARARRSVARKRSRVKRRS